MREKERSQDSRDRVWIGLEGQASPTRQLGSGIGARDLPPAWLREVERAKLRLDQVAHLRILLESEPPAEAANTRAGGGQPGGLGPL